MARREAPRKIDLVMMDMFLEAGDVAVRRLYDTTSRAGEEIKH
jgi:hypothetical protein